MLLLFEKKLYNRFVELLKLLKNCLLQSMSYIIKTVLRSHLTSSQEKPAHRANHTFSHVPENNYHLRT